MLFLAEEGEIEGGGDPLYMAVKLDMTDASDGLRFLPVVLHANLL